MLSTLSKFHRISTASFPCLPSNFRLSCNPLFTFSNTSSEFFDLNDNADSLGKGKQQFRQLYFPIKRIKFEGKSGFSKIYSNSLSSPQKLRIGSIMKKVFYSVPFMIYYANYLFLVHSDFLWHQITLGSLALGSVAMSVNDSIKLSREIAELYISQDGQQFIAIAPNSMFSTKFNELKGKLKGSMYDSTNSQGFKFSLNQIENVTLRSVGENIVKQEILDPKKNLKEEKLNAAESKKNILEKLSKIAENDETLLISIAKPNWNYTRTFRIALKNNDLSHYNDYMIALGYSQRIVMRESMAAEAKTVKQEDNQKQQQKEDNQQKQQEDAPIKKNEQAEQK